MFQPSFFFLADRMLGRLCRWLRIMGQDCEFIHGESLEEAIEKALCEKRILLSRNTRMLRLKRLGEHLFIQSDHLESQLIQVMKAYPIDPTANCFERCIECNTKLESITKTEAGSRIPVFVAETQKKIAHCPSCHRMYWGATHRARMLRRLEQLRQAVEKSQSQKSP